MNLRDLFDKMTPGMLDCEVVVKHVIGAQSKKPLNWYKVIAVEFEPDGGVVLVVSE